VRIFTPQELIPYLANIGQLEHKFHERNLTISEGADFIVEHLKDPNYYFADIRGDKILYFTIILREMWLYTPIEAYVWMHYVQKNSKEWSRAVLSEISKVLKQDGITRIIIDSTKSSFARWIEKQGFNKKTIVYEKEL
jgi:hypothetical protein